MFDWRTSLELGESLFMAGVEKPQAAYILERVAFSKYPKKRATHARWWFIRRAMLCYERNKEIQPERFGAAFKEGWYKFAETKFDEQYQLKTI